MVHLKVGQSVQTVFAIYLSNRHLIIIIGYGKWHQVLGVPCAVEKYPELTVVLLTVIIFPCLVKRNVKYLLLATSIHHVMALF